MEFPNLPLDSNKITELLELYVTEDQLNSCIKNDQELLLLQTILQLKLHFICQGKHAPVFFPIKDIVKQVATTNIDEICRVLYCALKIQNDESQYTYLLEYINESLCSYKDASNLICTLKLLQLALSLCKTENLQETFQRFSLASNFQSTIYSLLNNNSKTVVNFVSVYILPKYLSMENFDTRHLLELIWKNANETKHLNIVCNIAEFFLVSDAGHSLTNLENFWFTLQECLSCNDASFQKQALYLLKRAIYSLKGNDHFETESKTLFWNSECKEETYIAWQKLFMLFEISREKQLHLIEPAYHLLREITSLHWSWLLCVYKILLNHPHNAVSAYAILAIMKSDWYDDADIFKAVISHLLAALNKIEYTQKEDLWNKLREFVIKLNNEKFILLLELSVNITWIPPLCYRFCENVFCHQRLISMPFHLTDNFIKSIEKLPHKFIRNECKKLIVSFMNRAFLNNTNFNFKDYIMLILILYGEQYQLCDKQPENYEQYIPLVKQIIQSWISKDNINIKEVKVVLQLIELYAVETDWLEQNVINPFIERKFATNILDAVYLYLCKEGSNNNTITYLQERLITIKDDDEIDFPSMVLLLTKKENDGQQQQLADLFKTCSNILVDKDSTILQTQMAFQIVAKLSEKHFLLQGNVMDNIMQRWKHKFLKSCEKFNSHICLSFLRLYCTDAFKSVATPISKTKPEHIASEKFLEIITVFEKVLETQSSEVLLEIFKQLKYLLELSTNEEVVFSLVNMCFKKLTELKRTDIFKVAAENFVSSLICNSEMYNNNEAVVKMANDVTWKLLDLTKSCDDVAYSLAVHLHNLTKCNTNATATFIPIIVELLMFGDVLKRDQRAEYLVCQRILAEGGQTVNNNPNLGKLSVRREAVNIIEKLLTDKCITKEEQTKRADAITSILIDKYSQHFNKRYFSDSQIHLQKLRILQAMLVVHNYVATQKQPLVDLLINSVCMESHQISIKFLIIWLLIRLLQDNEECLAIVSSKMEHTSKAHSSTIIAFIPILYHIALWRDDESFFIHLFEILLPWTMGAHFNLRLHAQEGILNLYKTVHKRGYVNVCERFKAAFVCITEVLKKTEREIEAVDKYILSIFHVQDHYNLKTIYFDIPYITNVTCDEYENFLCSAEFNTKNTLLPLYNFKQLENLPRNAIEQQAPTTIIQKKITPWTKQFDNDIIERKVGELIVVASLIEKAPNLGGLSRTCEIFGVKQLAISTVNVVKNHEFQSVSMSSEKWVDMMEIKVDHLQSFLLNMKENGYVVVGAEQTSDSTQLNKLMFPKKCVLLLGNEKEGIPPNLLSLIDICCEIPQFGVVRSLNVHVAAATFIWEYTKQHMT